MTETFINKSTLQENYSTLPNKLINDEKLSGDGLAVLVYLYQSHQIGRLMHRILPTDLAMELIKSIQLSSS